eukprot:CAMPEP_0182514650 /NCGR_PEP_ID=MMETSP1321-20130603/36217_1 /TAXON_ID=91990 /ORGANISM="Bolidomonas sp., Strain RCC1657" /LENGTH=637 /DNA_ID=CAMNT_0024721895 /DNA_START=84 /DNA_END=1994 /DNA_ORIENTATION=+
MNLLLFLLVASASLPSASASNARTVVKQTLQSTIPTIESTAAFKDSQHRKDHTPTTTFQAELKSQPKSQTPTHKDWATNSNSTPSQITSVLHKRIKKTKQPSLFSLLSRRPRSDLQVVSGHGREEEENTQNTSDKFSASIIHRNALSFPPAAPHFLPSIPLVPPSLFSSTFRSYVFYPVVSWCLGWCGPAFTKWGQWASTRSDMFPSALCYSLSTLHANAPSHGWSHTKKLVTEGLLESPADCGSNDSRDPNSCWDSVFEEFDKAPVASGSIAQVHRAVIRNPDPALEGTTVAIKVRHPMVAELIDRDFRIMRKVGSVVDKLSGGWLNVRASIEQFSHTMAEQARLDVEGYHLSLLNHNFRAVPMVAFPRTIYATQSIIIETFETGDVIGDMFRSGESVALSDHAKEFIVTEGESLYLKMLLVDNLMHADLHPGNILVTFDDTKKQLTLVDAGMVASLTPEESLNFIGLLSALGAGDGRKAAEAVLGFGGPREPSEDDELFTEEIIELFSRICKGYGNEVDVGAVLRGVLSLVQKHKIRISANYATLVVNVLCIESMAKKLVPTYNVLDAAMPLLAAYRRICVYHPKSKLRKAVFKAWMPFAKLIKGRNDRRFFRKLRGEDNGKRRLKNAVKLIAVG